MNEGKNMAEDNTLASSNLTSPPVIGANVPVVDDPMPTADSAAQAQDPAVSKIRRRGNRMENIGLPIQLQANTTPQQPLVPSASDLLLPRQHTNSAGNHLDPWSNPKIMVAVPFNHVEQQTTDTAGNYTNPFVNPPVVTAAPF